jgi:hypothetical protein
VNQRTDEEQAKVLQLMKDRKEIWPYKPLDSDDLYTQAYYSREIERIIREDRRLTWTKGLAAVLLLTGLAVSVVYGTTRLARPAAQKVYDILGKGG